MSPDLYTHLILFVGVLALHFIGTTTSGVGLVSRPFTSWITGLPLEVVIATKRLAGFIPRITSLWAMRHDKGIDWSVAFTSIIPSALGGFIGALIVVSIPEETLESIAGYAVILGAGTLIARDLVGTREPPPIKSWLNFLLTQVGLFGANLAGTVTAGGGIFTTLVFIFVRKATYIQSMAYKKMSALGAGVLSIGVFIYNDSIDWTLIPTLMLAAGIGSWFGTKFALKRGEKFVRFLTIFGMLGFGVYLVLF